MNKSILAPLSLATLVFALQTGLWAASPLSPEWTKQKIVVEDGVIQIVGNSGREIDQETAKDGALADAADKFIKYCEVSKDAYARTLEVYSKKDGKKYAYADDKTQSFIRGRAFAQLATPEKWSIIRERRRYIASVLLKIPQKEMDRAVHEKIDKISLDVQLYREDDDGELQVVKEGGRIGSGRNYAVFARASDDIYLYVYQVDSAEETFRLFPNPGFDTTNNPVTGGTNLWIPNADDFYTLNDATGKERIYFIVSFKEVSEFEGKEAISLPLQKINAVIAKKKFGKAIPTRKLKRAFFRPRHNKRNATPVERKLQAEGPFVHETWFLHE